MVPKLEILFTPSPSLQLALNGHVTNSSLTDVRAPA